MTQKSPQGRPALSDLKIDFRPVSNLATESLEHTLNTSRGPCKANITQQVIAECLETLDIFKEIMDDPLQRRKVVRDVKRNIKICIFDAQSIIYNKGDVSEQIYFVLKGSVSVRLPIFKPTDGADKQHEGVFEYQEIEVLLAGTGFGEGQFVSNKRRGLTAAAKENESVVGSIGMDSFQEIIDNYKQRVYYKKFEMFENCPLLRTLQPYQIQFIVNNAKPILFPISKLIVLEGEKAKFLYLILNGQVELRKAVCRSPCKDKSSATSEKQPECKIKNIKVGIVEEGSFLGDFEMALGEAYDYTAICKAEKVVGYACDERIVMSQMTQNSFLDANNFYSEKKKYYLQKSVVHEKIKQQIEKSIEDQRQILFNPEQMNMRRQIKARYAEKVPSLIGQCSPKEIALMIDRKLARIKTEPIHNYLPNIEKISPTKYLKRKSPAPRKLKTLEDIVPKIKTSRELFEKKTDNFENYEEANSRLMKITEQLRRPFEVSQPEQKPLLAYMRPFHKKVVSLHERLAKELNLMRQKTESSTIGYESEVVSIRRLKEIVRKIKFRN